MSDSMILLLLLFGACGGGLVMYSTQMKKTYLHELEKGLEIQGFVMTGSLGKASVEGKWKGQRIGIEALPSGPGLPSSITYRMESRSSFTADIRPGSAILQKAAETVKGAGEEETFRPWRAKLTEEEAAVIKSRAGEVKEDPKEQFRITSPKPDDVAAFLGEKGRSEAVAELFAGGCTLVQIGFAEVVAVKSPYGSKDMTPRMVLQILMRLRALQSEPGK